MTITKGCDSASEPTLAQARAAKAQGISFWGVYLAGPGAFHNWSPTGLAVLKEAGISPLPIFVPAMSDGVISSSTPTDDARAFVDAMHTNGIDGAAVLDTEASMRGHANTATYTESFCAELRLLGQKDICYEGGFTLEAPSTATYHWWVIDSTSPPTATAYQATSGTIEGLQVDFDYAGAGFPVANFGYNPTPTPTPVPAPITPEVDVDAIYIRDTTTGECGLVLSNGTSVNLSGYWPDFEAAYAKAKVPMVLVEAEGIFKLFPVRGASA